MATVQTTAIDRAAGVVNLATLLAHSSGEWIATTGGHDFDQPIHLVLSAIGARKSRSSFGIAGDQEVGRR